ncbi:MAG: hypothetical protein Q7R91_02445 [bacterium]|nr:hypothetical protein [bacterium]
MLRSRVFRFLRRHGLPTQPEMWLIMVFVCVLGGAFSAYVTSDAFRFASVEVLARQHLFNTTGKDVPVSVTGGNLKDGFTFSILYKKVEQDGTVSRRGVFSGTAWPNNGRVEGRTKEQVLLRGDRGHHSVSTTPEGVVEIRTEK